MVSYNTRLDHLIKISIISYLENKTEFVSALWKQKLQLQTLLLWGKKTKFMNKCDDTKILRSKIQNYSFVTQNWIWVYLHIINTVNLELTTTSEKWSPVYNNHHFLVPFWTFITYYTSEQRLLVNNGRCSQVWLYL